MTNLTQVAHNVWPNWVTQTTTTTNVSWQQDVWSLWGQQPQDVWSLWGQQYNAVWGQWQGQPLTEIVQTTAPTLIVGPTVEWTPPEPTPEERRLTLIARSRSHSNHLRRRLATRRAEALLLEHLSSEQVEDWVRHSAFTVETAGGRAYRITYGLVGNVRLVRAATPPRGRSGYPLRVGARFCAHVYHPDGWVPTEDNMLAQKLLIETNEAAFLAMANVS